MKRTKVLGIFGPTAAGKTSIAIYIAKRLGGEIISCDSMQIYDELFIGTARPTREEMAGIPHHLMGFIKPDIPYTVALYQRDAQKAIEKIAEKGKLPMLVGGTGLYANAITYELDFSRVTADDSLRQQLSEIYETKGALYLHELLAQKDPAAAARIHPNDKKRLIRRLEVLERGEDEQPFDFNRLNQTYDFLLFGITKTRELLYRDIEHRVDDMLMAGLEEEARRIFDKYGKDITAFQAIGYKEFLPYFAGEMTCEETIERIKRNTRRFAKRQLTWFRRDPRIHWIEIDAYASREAATKAMITEIENWINEERTIEG